MSILYFANPLATLWGRVSRAVSRPRGLVCGRSPRLGACEWATPRETSGAAAFDVAGIH